MIQNLRKFYRNNKDVLALLFASLLLAWFLYTSATWIGYLFGWMIGASITPVGAVAIPLVFGLLGIVGISVGYKIDYKSPMPLLWAAYVAFCVTAFCHRMDQGLGEGIDAREQAAAPVSQK